MVRVQGEALVNARPAGEGVSLTLGDYVHRVELFVYAKQHIVLFGLENILRALDLFGNGAVEHRTDRSGRDECHVVCVEWVGVGNNSGCVFDAHAGFDDDQFGKAQ